jgi:hypothetical protein
MSRVFNPVYSSPTDGEDITLCRILEAVGNLSHAYASGTPYHVISASGLNAANVKASSGYIYNMIISNMVSSARFVFLYDKATTPVAGTDTPVYVIGLNANQTISIPLGNNPLVFNNGIGLSMATSNAGTGNVSASDVIFNFTLA